MSESTRASTPGGVGSNPVPRSNAQTLDNRRKDCRKFYCLMSINLLSCLRIQLNWLEHHLAMVGVVSSNLIIRSSSIFDRETIDIRHQIFIGGMKIHNYKELKVWNRGMDLCELTYSYLHSFPASESSLKNQIKRCSVSIPSNIAE